MTALSSELVLSGQRRATTPLSTMRLKPAANSCATISGSTPKLRMSRKRRAMRYTSPSCGLPAALYQQAVDAVVPMHWLPALRSAMSQSTSTQSTPSASISRTILVAQPSSTMSGLRSAYCASAPILEEPSAFIRSSAWSYAASRMRSPKATRSAISAVSSKKPVPSAPHKQRAKWSKPPRSNLPAAEPSTTPAMLPTNRVSKAPIRQTLPDPKSFGLTSGKRPTVGDTVSKLSASGAEICWTNRPLNPTRVLSGKRAASQPPSSQGASPRASLKRQATVLVPSNHYLPDAKRRAEQLLSSRDGVPAASIGAA